MSDEITKPEPLTLAQQTEIEKVAKHIVAEAFRLILEQLEKNRNDPNSLVTIINARTGKVTQTTKAESDAAIAAKAAAYAATLLSNAQARK